MEENDDPITEQDLAEYREIEKYDKEHLVNYHAWLRNVLVLASGLFAVIIGLRGQEVMSVGQYLAFLVALATLGLGILFGVAALYIEALVPRLNAGATLENRRKRKAGETTSLLLKTKVPKWLKRCRKACHTTLCLALVALFVYATFLPHSPIEFPRMNCSWTKE